MSTLELLAAIVLLLLVAALIVFAARLHAVVEQLRSQVEKDLLVSTQLQDTMDRMVAHTKVVAKNLAASTGRADAANDSGSAADAALRSEQ